MLIDQVDFDEVLNEFVEEQTQLLINDAGEQALAHQLAVKIASLFKGWDVDCEYNRNHNDVKRLIYAVTPNGSANEKNVVPDIIVHRRMTNKNLLAIEIKKTTNKEQSFKDLAKLTAFKEQLGYQHTLFVRFLSGSDPAAISEIRWG